MIEASNRNLFPMKYRRKQSALSKIQHRMKNNKNEYEKLFARILRKYKINYVEQRGWLKGHRTFCISDFYLPEHKLSIEIDGLYHLKPWIKYKDKQKEKYLFEKRHVKTIRFTNKQVLTDESFIVDTLVREGILYYSN